MKKILVFFVTVIMLMPCVLSGVALTATSAGVSAEEKNAASNLSYNFPREGVSSIAHGTMVAPDPWVVKKDNYYYFCYYS